MSYKYNIEKLLKEGHSIQINPQGYSMYPLLIPGRDKAVVIPYDKNKALKRGDVVLFRDPATGLLTLHRLYKAKNNSYYFLGDNEHIPQGPLDEDCILGTASSFERNGKIITSSNPLYLIYSSVWLFIRPLRPVISKIIHTLKIWFKPT